MNIFINILVSLLCLVFGYVLGSTNISILIGKMVFNQDPRDYASRNCGATNCGRLWGKKYFFIVFFFDVFKTISPLFIAWAVLSFVPFNNGMPLLPSAYSMYIGDVNDYIITWPVYYLASIGSLFGSVFPLFTNFRGGKAVSCMSGFVFSTSWLISIIGMVGFFVTIFKSRFVSLSSIVSGIVGIIVAWVLAIIVSLRLLPNDIAFIFQFGPLFYCNYIYAITLTLEVIVMIIRHKQNIIRLINHNERQVQWIKSKNKV